MCWWTRAAISTSRTRTGGCSSSGGPAEALGGNSPSCHSWGGGRPDTGLITQRLDPIPGTLYPNPAHMQRVSPVGLVLGNHQYRVSEREHPGGKQGSRRYAGILRPVEFGHPAAFALKPVAIGTGSHKLISYHRSERCRVAGTGGRFQLRIRECHLPLRFGARSKWDCLTGIVAILAGARSERRRCVKRDHFLIHERLPTPGALHPHSQHVKSTPVHLDIGQNTIRENPRFFISFIRDCSF